MARGLGNNMHFEKDYNIDNPRFYFRKGVFDAMPIFFGYLSVGFAFGISAIKYGHPAWSPLLMSSTHLSGTGQFAIIEFLNKGSGIRAAVLAVLIFNVRYILMSLSIAQRLPPGLGVARRMLVACGDTDEIVGVAVKQSHSLTFGYLMGLTLCSYVGWVGGALIAVFPATSSLLSSQLVSALGIALYAMFVAIIIPEARRSGAILLCVSVAAISGIFLRLSPLHINTGWITIICGVFGAVISAVLYPKEAKTSASARGAA